MPILGGCSHIMTCPRCSGFIYCGPDNEPHCLSCGHYPMMPTLPAPGPSPARQWVAGTCDCGRAAVRGKELCMVCRGRSRGEAHGEKVKRGMALAKDVHESR